MRVVISDPALLLDVLQREFSESSKTTLRQMLEQGRVRVNGSIEKAAKRVLRAGDRVDVAGKQAHRDLPPTLSVLYEDDAIIVVFKEAGLLSVAHVGESEDTAQAYLNRYRRAKGNAERIHVVHRLDRDTSGVMLFAKSFPIREQLKEAFAQHDIERLYNAIVEGVIHPPEGTIISNLVEHPRTFHVRSTNEAGAGKRAVTHYRTLRHGATYSLLEVTLETGRKNQIRAHLSEKGNPVTGDERYGATTNPLGRLALHAAILGFRHPVTGREMKFSVPMPEAFEKLAL
ncbi:MAG TPA: RluA family pseudouridine synthase [Thermoanaerobaculia bacterium]|nr:RluA family pseudouridine synthase [Thermoanaerobaculia bacterium]